MWINLIISAVCFYVALMLLVSGIADAQKNQPYWYRLAVAAIFLTAAVWVIHIIY